MDENHTDRVSAQKGELMDKNAWFDQNTSTQKNLICQT